jgi:hypothetical protein
VSVGGIYIRASPARRLDRTLTLLRLVQQSGAHTVLLTVLLHPPTYDHLGTLTPKVYDRRWQILRQDIVSSVPLRLLIYFARPDINNHHLFLQIHHSRVFRKHLGSLL